VESIQESIPLIRTKLQMPRLADDLVRRPEHNARLDSGLESQLTLVSAPAGYGKTTLVASWLQETPRMAAWLSLDENDNDLLRFLRYMVAAIRTLYIESCKEVHKMTRADYEPPAEYLAALFINDISDLQDSFLLVIDDFHLIESVAVRAFVSVLIENQPLNMHLVIITRTDPLLPLARLRASGKMAEIRASDLRFRNDEAETFLKQTMGTAVGHETASASNTRAEGWITGLRLIALSASNEQELSRILASTEDHSISFVNEYLLSEVLFHLPQPLRVFLLHISILNRLSAPLCDAVALINEPNQSSEVFLNWVRKSNIFVNSLDDNEEWLRFHHLFQAFLFKELKANYSEDELQELHHRAARWFAEQGFIEEAMNHALEADDVDMAAALIEQRSQELLNSPARRSLQRWLSYLPQETIWQRPRLILAKAWLLFREFRLSALEDALSVADTSLEKAPLADDERRDVQGQIASLRSANSYTYYQDYEQSVYWAEKALADLPQTAYGARGLAIGVLGASQQALGNLDSAVQYLESFIYAAADPGPAKIQAFSGLAMVYQAEAQTVPLSLVLSQFLQSAAGSNNPNGIAVANRHAGWLSYEQNDIDQAIEHFMTTLAYRYQSSFGFTFDATLGLARTFLAEGEHAKAQDVIDDLRLETLRLENNDLIGHLESFQASLWLSEGNHHSALRWARSVDSDALNETILVSEVASLTQARVLIELGSSEEAKAVVRMLKRKLQKARKAHFKLRMIQIKIHLALAYDRLDQGELALNVLEQALELAYPGGFIRSFTDMGPAILPVLNRLKQSGVYPLYIEQIIASFPDTDLRSDLRVDNEFLPTLLTPRQTEILELLRKGHSYKEIAGDLGVSLNTVRKHVSNVYEKLDANNRQEAIYKAAAFRLVS
jgi:LuxR family maltose regulon positive regulatory protein